MNQTAGKTRMRISFLLLGFAVVALVVVHATVSLLDAWRAEQQRPRLAVESLVKALRAHHRQTGRFPADFRELEARVWKHKKAPDFGPKFGEDGRSLSVANYFYLYHPVDAGACTIWIVPTGPRREEGSTHFLLLAPGNLRRWRGAPLILDELKRLPSVPQYREMALLGMTEQQQIELGSPNRLNQRTP